VETKALNRAVRRNAKRFPDDFMFPLTPEELDNLRYQFGTSSLTGDSNLRSQIVTSKPAWGGRRYNPLAFTEHGAVMLATILNSRVAVDASIQVVRAFVQLRSFVTANANLATRLDKMEGLIFDTIRYLIGPDGPHASLPLLP